MAGDGNGRVSESCCYWWGWFYWFSFGCCLIERGGFFVMVVERARRCLVGCDRLIWLSMLIISGKCFKFFIDKRVLLAKNLQCCVSSSLACG